MNVPVPQNSPPSTTTAAPPRPMALTERLYVRLKWQGNVPTLDEPLGHKDSLMLKEELAACRRALMPLNAMSDRERIGVALLRLFAGYANTGSLSSPQHAVAAYLGKLKELPAWAIEQAIHDIERGRVGGMSPDFPPSAARIYQLAELLLAPVTIEKSQIETLLAARIAEAPPRHPEEVARVAAAMKDFAAKMGNGLTEAENEKRRIEREAVALKKAKAEEHTRRMEYILHGFEPPTNSKGVTMCLSLARAMHLPLVKRKSAPPPNDGFLMPADKDPE